MSVPACPSCGASSWSQVPDIYAYSCLSCGRLLTDRDACFMDQGTVIGNTEPGETARILDMYQSCLIAQGKA